MIFIFCNTAVAVISGVTYIDLKSVIRCRDSFEVVSHMFNVLSHAVDVVTHGVDVVTLAVDVVTHTVGTYSAIATQ